MPEEYQSLTEKEKETLRLLVRGYDAKTIARHFELSVHTINERLRNARRKMSVSSSREAARLLLVREEGDPDFYADKLLGEAELAGGMIAAYPPDESHGKRIILAMLIGGVVIMSIILAALILSSTSPKAVPAVATAPVKARSVAASTTSDVAQSALQWLALVDQYKWNESWEATGDSFKELNSAEKWAQVAGEVQPPLGAVVSRSVSSQESVPAPPYGYEMVKFSTTFENKPSATETLTLVREDSTWKVVGYWIE